MNWKRRALLFTLIFAGAGSLVGYFLGVQDFKFPESNSRIGIIKGLIFDAPAGFLIVWLSHLYKDVIQFRPVGGAIVCLIPGLMIGTLVGLWQENERRWQNPLIASNSNSTLMILEPVLWGGLVGVAIGFFFGAVDQVVLSRRQRRSPVVNPSEPETSN